MESIHDFKKSIMEPFMQYTCLAFCKSCGIFYLFIILIAPTDKGKLKSMSAMPSPGSAEDDPIQLDDEADGDDNGMKGINSNLVDGELNNFEDQGKLLLSHQKLLGGSGPLQAWHV
jgi:hypothetical protein